MAKSLKPPANAPTASLKSAAAKKKKTARKAPTASLKPPQ